MGDYLLTIVIPTKNRQHYCTNAIKQILANTSSRVQLVIQDNSDDSSVLSSFVSSLENKRVFYHCQEKTLSFVDNFSEALSFCSGDYVCMIGDDDGVLRSIESAAMFAKNEGIDCFIPSQNAVYIWPSNKPIVNKAENGYLCLSYLHESLEKIDVKKTLKKLLKQGFQNYQKLKIPRLYHGIVKKKKLEEIKNTTGHYFGGLTPDMYMVVALSLVCENVVFSKMPITISGICPESGSSASATGRHTGKLAEAPHFVGHHDYLWNKLVPPVYTVETIWADTGLHALSDFKQDELIEMFDKKRLLVMLTAKYPQFGDEFSAFQKEHGKVSYASVLMYKASNIYSFFKKAVRRMFRRKGEVQKFYNVQDIHAAAVIANKRCLRINESLR